MTDQVMLDLLGYAASLLVAVSLMMSSVLKLRVINMIGAITFTVYGVLIQAYPVAAVNLLIVGINTFYLRKMLSTREYFSILEVESGSEYLRAFLRFHREQIARFFPGFVTPSEPGVAVFVLRDLVPAGLLMGDVVDDTLRVQLDFVIPQYRDLKVGRYLFHDQCGYFAARGIRSITAEANSAEHADYLSRIGFTADARVATGRGYRLALRC